MPRTFKSSRGSGFGKSKYRGKKTEGQKHEQEMGRFWRKIIEKRVREQNPQMTEKQIRAEVKKKKAERNPRKQPPPTSYTTQTTRRKKEWWEL